MKNIDQIRAKNALDAGETIGSGVKDGDVVKKIPTYIINNGILATAAFAMEKRVGYEDVFKAIVKHLQSENVKKLPDMVLPSSKGLLEYLVRQDSSVLRDVTAETMAYLNYLRRFADRCNKKEEQR